MIKITKILVIILLILTSSHIVKSNEIEKLRDLYNQGVINEEELKKAISIVEIEKEPAITNNRIKIRKLSETVSGSKFEKLEFYIDNYRVHTLRPGAIFIDNMLTGETDVILKDNFKVEMTYQGEKYFKFINNEKDLTSQLNYKGKMLINWTGKYVRKHQATFYQMQVLGYVPFHFYIKLSERNKTVAINVNYFTDKINKAVSEAKSEIAIKYNLSVEDIDRIMENKENKIDAEVERLITDEQQKILKDLTEKYVGQEIDDKIRAEIERTVGEELADAFITAIEQASGEAIDKAIEQEVANEVDRAIEYAIEQGVSQAAAEAAIAAMLWIYAMGGTDAEAMEACRYYAGDAC